MIESHNKGTLLSIRVKPRSKKQSIQITDEEVCDVHVKAPPIRGQANTAVVKLFSKNLGIPSHRIRIVSGEKAANKVLLIENMSPQSVLKALQS
jgi:uncharacterized protein (TIGR00251 family)